MSLLQNISHNYAMKSDRLAPDNRPSHGLPSVVPAECIEYLSPDAFSSRCTSATSFDTDAVDVPSGIRQKSAVHAGGVAMLGKFPSAMTLHSGSVCV